MATIANPEWNPWENDRNVFELYRKRCRQEIEEMTCAAQAAEIFSDKMSDSESILDVGCGGGYYFWSFYNRKINIDYYGLDYTPLMIKLARDEISKRSIVSNDHFILDSIENINQKFDNMICFNVLTNNPHYALPLERMLVNTRKRLLIRESFGEDLKVLYTCDKYLDEGKRHIKVYHNTYPIKEVISFIESYNFKVTQLKDKRSNDGVEMVCDIPHTWRILLAERKK